MAGRGGPKDRGPKRRREKDDKGWQKRGKRKFCQFCKDKVDRVDYKDVVVLRKFGNLKVLSLRHVRLTNAGIENVAALTGLTDLDLSTSSQYSRVGDAGIQLLASLTNLKSLNLDYNPVTDAALERRGDRRGGRVRARERRGAGGVCRGRGGGDLRGEVRGRVSAC